MARTPKPPASQAHFVVDGSNIATEGRSQPSLDQLNEAVLAFMDDHPGAMITVVVDATFGHRIDKKEVAAFDEAVANNELVTPPAGAVGRGDAFVLQIANKAKAGILSNDSFQEFHGDFPWLFDDGRLIGGKPVPHVGWVFVARLPVRGPKSRQSVRQSRDAQDSDGAVQSTRASGGRRRRGAASAAPAAPTEPLVPKMPPPGPAKPTASVVAAAAAVATTTQAASGVNELLPFLEFVERHPVGTSCTGVIESYSSHGAYARVGDVLTYVPLRLMDDPPPRSARSRLSLNDAVTLVIVGYAPERRSIDAALPHMVPANMPVTQLAAVVGAPDGDSAPTSKPAKRSRAKKAVAEIETSGANAAETAAAAPTPVGRRATGKKAAAAPTATRVGAAKSPAKRSPKPADVTVTASAASSRPARAKKATAEVTKAPAKRAPAKSRPATDSPATPGAAKQPAAKKSVAKKSVAKSAAKDAGAGAKSPRSAQRTDDTAGGTAT